MPDDQRQGREQRFFGPGLSDPGVTVLGSMARNAAQMTEVQRALVALSMTCAGNVIESAIVTQRELVRQTLDALLQGDPIALMSLCQRAAHTGFREGMDCAARNLQAAKNMRAEVLDTTTAAGTDPGAKPHPSKE